MHPLPVFHPFSSLILLVYQLSLTTTTTKNTFIKACSLQNYYKVHLRHTPYWEIYLDIHLIEKSILLEGKKKGNKSIAIKIVPEVDLDKELVYCLFG